MEYYKILTLENLPNEEWKNMDIIDGEDYEGYYSGSSYGRIKRNERNIINKNGVLQYFPEKILSQSYDGKKNPYLMVGLSKNNVSKSKRVHRLISFLFIPNDDPQNKTQVNHKDENKLNNCAYNLEWCTPEYNMNYGTRTQRQSEALKEKYANREIKFNFPNPKVPVVQLNENFIKIKTWNSITEIANFWGVKPSNISRVLTSNNNSYKGYYWMYLEDYIEMVQFFNEINCCNIPVDGFIDFSK